MHRKNSQQKGSRAQEHIAREGKENDYGESGLTERWNLAWLS